MRAAAGLVLSLAFGLSGCFGADFEACDQRPGDAGDEVAVRAVWNATAPAEAVAGACIQAYPTDAAGRTGDLGREARADASGRAALRLEEAFTWRVFATVATPGAKTCAHTSQTIEVKPPAAEELVLRVDRGQEVCA